MKSARIVLGGWLWLLICPCSGITASLVDDSALRQAWERHPERLGALFKALNPQYPGMAAVTTAIQHQDMIAASRELLRYYQDSNPGARFRQEPPDNSETAISAAEQLKVDRFFLLGREYQVPRADNGGLNWAWNGPEQDREWGWHLNRHTHLHVLLDAWEQTGNLDYVRIIEAHVIDWILNNPPPDQKSASPQWRGIEVFHRLCFWPRVFYRLAAAPDFSPTARLLMLAAIPDHARYLMRFSSAGGSHVISEMNGLAMAADCWPEFKESPAWAERAKEWLAVEIEQQVYPDGAAKDLSAHYHRVALDGFMNLFYIYQRSGTDLPAGYYSRLEQMWAYLAGIMRPDGLGPLNNDSFHADFRDSIRRAARLFQRPDWAWIASGGTEGRKPEGQKSVMFPWAGQLIMRSRGGDQHWAFFDIGPWGVGHQHQDLLHLSIWAWGRDLLVDGGADSYLDDAWRKYFTGSAAHNVILVDGKGQNPGKTETHAPLADDSWRISPLADYARGTVRQGFEDTSGQAIHTRAVYYLKDNCWVAADRIDTDRPRQIQALWHYHPDCTLTIQGQSVTSADLGKGNLRIDPLAAFAWDTEIVTGRIEPEIQGWRSDNYNQRRPGPTAVFSARIEQSVTFAWLLTPADGLPPQIKAELLAGDENAVLIRFPADGIEVRVSLK